MRPGTLSRSRMRYLLRIKAWSRYLPRQSRAMMSRTGLLLKKMVGLARQLKLQSPRCRFPAQSLRMGAQVQSPHRPPARLSPSNCGWIPAPVPGLWQICRQKLRSLNSALPPKAKMPAPRFPTAMLQSRAMLSLVLCVWPGARLFGAGLWFVVPWCWPACLRRWVLVANMPGIAGMRSLRKIQPFSPCCSPCAMRWAASCRHARPSPI